jgi:signal transduction histidine kinase
MMLSSVRRIRDGIAAPWWGSIGNLWHDASISVRFSIVAGLITLSGMIVVGEWAARRVEAGVIDNHVADAALFTDSVIAAHLQELHTSDTLSSEARARVTALLAGFLDRSMVGYRIWKGDTIVHAERPQLVGQTLPPSAMRTKAASGEVVSALRAVSSAQFATRVSPGQRLLEIYAPVRRFGSNEIIALVETYEVALALESDVATARFGSWLIIGCIGALMQALQIVTVHGASRMIERQKRTLAERVDTLSRMLAENSILRLRTEAGTRLAENNERFLRKIGADLHDGPLQLLGVATLRLDDICAQAAKSPAALGPDDIEELEFLRECLGETAREIRDIAAGLSLPDLDAQPLETVVTLSARRHERLSGLPVTLAIRYPLPDVSQSMKECVYRVVQEGLSNVLRHAAGKGQGVSVGIDAGVLRVDVVDEGPGLQAPQAGAEGTAQGLSGLRDRVQALGGELTLAPRPGGGSQLTAVFEMGHEADAARRVETLT